MGSAFALGLLGCATQPTLQSLQLPAVALTVVGNRTIMDGRSEFRSVFCERLLAKDLGNRVHPCDDFLWRLPDEKPSFDPLPPGGRVEESPLRVFIVGGAFGDCYPPASTPFTEAVAGLKQAGVRIEYIDVSGRSSSALNADTIANRILSEPPDTLRPIVLIGYSKGAADILETLVRRPEVRPLVSAVVSVAGAVNGSPLATEYAGLYGRVLSQRALGACPPGNGGVLGSLTRSTRLHWLSDNILPPEIRYFSIGTFTTPSHLARVLAIPQRQLSKIDARNDGQLLVQDELIPGGTLLGYANADHWSVAVRLEDRFPFLAHRQVGKHPFPQRALLESILLFVERDLARADNGGRS
jgi:hypothetical protein